MPSIPVISPIDITFSAASAKLLPPPEASVVEEEPDYTVQTTPPPPLFIVSPALMALNELEHALEISEYHDFGWYRKHLSVIRAALKPARPDTSSNTVSETGN